MGYHQLDELDEKILKLIVGNARIPFLEVARECNVSGAAIHQRIQKLTNLGVIKGSEFIIDNTKVGYETCAYMGLFLKSPGQFPDVTEALKAIPEVVECHYTTGQYDLFIKIYAKNNQHLLSIIHNKLQPLSIEERMDRFGLKPDRADVIVPAAEIFLIIADCIHADFVYVPTIGLADGIIGELYAKAERKERERFYRGRLQLSAEAQGAVNAETVEQEH